VLELETDEVDTLDVFVLSIVGLEALDVEVIDWALGVEGTVKVTVVYLVELLAADGYDEFAEPQALEVGTATIVCVVAVPVVGIVLDVSVFDAFVVEDVGGRTTELELGLELVAGFVLDVMTELSLKEAPQSWSW
jgi:hypothetical protein